MSALRTAALALVAMAPAVSASAGGYSVTDLGLVGSSRIGIPHAINTPGVVVGSDQFQGGADRYAWSWQNGTLTNLTPASALGASANAINDLNEIAGGGRG